MRCGWSDSSLEAVDFATLEDAGLAEEAGQAWGVLRWSIEGIVQGLPLLSIQSKVLAVCEVDVLIFDFK